MTATLRRLRGGTRAMWQIARHGRPRQVLLFGPLSLGDDLLCTTVLHEARRRGTPFAMMTARPELFLGNPDPLSVLPIDDYYAEALRRLGSAVVQPYYATQDPHAPQRDRLPNQHILAEMCRQAGLTGEIQLRPYLRLAPEELQAGRRVAERQVAIQSSCLSARVPYPTKDWGAERFAEVVCSLRGKFSFVQLGAASDPALPVDLDLRGRTSLRESAAVLAASVAFVGLEGFLTHLARAVDCPAVVVHGGRAAAAVFSYAANRNLFGRPPCSPCGLRDGCPYDLACMDMITAESVACAVRDFYRAPPMRPLPAETCVVA